MRIIKPSFEIETPEGFLTYIIWRLEKAARTAYKSEAEITVDNVGKVVKLCIQRGHESVIEHESISVRIICDRGVSHELVRHRIASYTQESTRYCNYGKQGEVTFILPCFWEKENETPFGARPLGLTKYEQWELAMYRAELSYLALLKAGATPQEARSVLPNSLKTEIVMTCNLREWRHFFKLRTAKAAHPQMREITIPMLAKFKELVPVVFDDIQAEV